MASPNIVRIKPGKRVTLNHHRVIKGGSIGLPPRSSLDLGNLGAKLSRLKIKKPENVTLRL